jgi:hypothetical protein
MDFELHIRQTISVDIDELYEFCKDEGYIKNGEVECSIYTILCEFLEIDGYVEDDWSEEIEDRIRTKLNEMAEAEEYDYTDNDEDENEVGE